MRAYNEHHALSIRPDDVWFAILSQFSLFVNANTESLRYQFVAHDGQKELLIVVPNGTRYTVDYTQMASIFTKLLDQNVSDLALRAWILPSFSTTTTTDQTIGAIMMMATLKSYFKYTIDIRCGIPRVTLQGTKSDWEDILGRLEKLKEYGKECIAWYHLLHPILSRFVKSFDEPEAGWNLDFWNRVIKQDHLGSCPPIISGWMTAFCVFDAKGKWQGHPFRHVEESESTSISGISSLSTASFFAQYMDVPPAHSRIKILELDGAIYPTLDLEKSAIPPSIAEVNVKVIDNGVEFPCIMVAGLVGMKAVSSKGDISESGTMKPDTLEPLSGWWMYIEQES